MPQLSSDPLSGPIPAASEPARPAAVDDMVMEMPTWRKWVTLFVVCWMALPVTFSGSSILTATKEVAADFGVSTHAISTANAGVFIAMALSALIWLPTSNILGRRTAYLLANSLLTLCSIGSALSNNLACFTAIWVIGGTTGPFFLVAGQTILADIFEPNVTCGLLGFNQYGLLSSVRRVINPRFGLTSPLISGLFYLAPGAGFLLGSTLGGRLSDHTVKRYIRKRNGLRLPQDRLRASLPAIFVILPVGTLLYGWSVQKEVGGMPLPIISSFVQGLGLMWSFSGLNTYSAEALPEHRTAVISGKYIIQYSFGAGAVGGLVPMIDAIGVGWAFTINKVGSEDDE
ncbi:hypothetical protein N0V92_008531 [Colletotrichum tropicale]|nr:hypothetical protein N0V92_008531 [Colletotrichum tropicale]